MVKRKKDVGNAINGCRFLHLISRLVHGMGYEANVENVKGSIACDIENKISRGNETSRRFGGNKIAKRPKNVIDNIVRKIAKRYWKIKRDITRSIVYKSASKEEGIMSSIVRK